MTFALQAITSHELRYLPQHRCLHIFGWSEVIDWNMVKLVPGQWDVYGLRM